MAGQNEDKPAEPAAIEPDRRQIIGGGAAGTLAYLMSLGAARGQVGSEPFLGSIMLVAFNFAPRGWATCNGQSLAIAQNQALFALLGTAYGGNGQTTFALPDLQGRAPLGFAPGAAPIGTSFGEASHTLLASEMPQHSHTVNAGDTAPASRVRQPPTGNVLTRSNESEARVFGGPTNLVALAASSLGASGGSQPHNNMQPYLVLNYVIALQGIFPSRN